jgi:hypothetical protein
MTTHDSTAAGVPNGTLTPQQHAPSSSNSEAHSAEHSQATGNVSGEADANLDLLDVEHDGTELEVPPNPIPLSEVCADVNRRISAFLALDAGNDEAVRRTQGHVRASSEIIARALEEYG